MVSSPEPCRMASWVFFAQILPLGVEREPVVLAERVQGLDVVGARRFRPWRDRAAAQGLVLVGDDEIGVDVLLDAETAAGRAGAEWIVEREQPRLDLRNGEARDRTGEFFREDQPLGPAAIVNFCGLSGRRLGVLPPSPAGRLPGGGAGVGELHYRQSVGELERRLQRIGQPRCRDRAAPPGDPPPHRCRA